MLNEFIDDINNMIGTKCWDTSNVIIGALRLNFGKAIHIGLSSGISDTGQYSVLIWCQWRLDDENISLCSWECSHEVINQVTACLIGDAITAIEIFPPVWDAVFTFSSGKKIKIFCDCTNAFDLSPNWHFGIMDNEYYMGVNNVLEKGKRLGIISNELFDVSTIKSDSDEISHQTLTSTTNSSYKKKDFVLLEEIREQLSFLIGQQCRRVTSKDDQSLQLDFGGLIKRECSEKEKNETGKDFCYEGEYDILIWCAWRLQDSEDAICSSDCPDELCKEGVKRLIGEKVVSIEIFSPAWDAAITFSSGLVLKIFCTYTKDTGADVNWFFRNVWKLYYINSTNGIEKARIDWDILEEPIDQDKIQEQL
jgi:hypothetical protein